MTRFDEALRQFAQRAEAGMRERTGSAGNRYATVQEVSRARTRRTALQVMASLVAVAVVGGAAWLAADQLRTVAPAAPPVTEITYLGDPSDIRNSRIVCGVPLPVDVGQEVTTASGSQEVPKITQAVVVGDATEAADADLTPGATTVPTEDSLGVTASVTWEGAEPQFWGLSTFGVLVDANGLVVARTQLVESWNVVTGDVGPGANVFSRNSCASATDDDAFAAPDHLDGPYRVHVITQLWTENRRHPVVQWVDAGLPKDAQVTLDWDAYLQLQAEQDQALQDQVDAVKAVFAGSRTTLATIKGTAVVAAAGACAMASALEDGGLGAVPAIAADIPTAPIEWSSKGFSWSFAGAAEDPGWDWASGFTVVFVDSAGDVAGVSLARPSSTLEGDITTSTAHFSADSVDGPCDATVGLPSAPGDYAAYMAVSTPGLDASYAPVEFKGLGGFDHLSTWVPMGTYTVP